MNVGVWQVVLILLIVLVIFGAGKLPKVMGDLGKGIKNFKGGLADEEPTPTVSSSAPPPPSSPQQPPPSSPPSPTVGSGMAAAAAEVPPLKKDEPAQG